MEKYKNHTFAICAYKESPYLEECIRSLLNQTIKSNVIMATSTPNEHISKLSEKYHIPFYINTGEKGIGQDWNYAVSQAKTDYVTVAHQDDIYKSDYLEEIVKQIEKTENCVMAFTNYTEIKNGKENPVNTNLKIKELMMFPLRFFRKSRWIKRSVLSLGNPICCPSVTVNRKKVGEKPYRTNLKCSLDWDTWLAFAEIEGEFVYIPKRLMSHRIHEQSETTALIENNVRLEEDLEIFKRLWPNFIANMLMKQYKNSVKSNTVKEK